MRSKVEKVNEYQQLARRTECDQTKSLMKISSEQMYVRLLHSCLGMTSDFYELETAHDHVNMMEEIGDLCWYLAQACNAMEVNMDVLGVHPEMALDQLRECSQKDCISEIRRSMSDLSYLLEKVIYYNQVFDQSKIIAQLAFIFNALQNLCGIFEVPITLVMESNLAKLRNRFPDKFEESLAVEESRDRTEEARVIKEVHAGKRKAMDDGPSYV